MKNKLLLQFIFIFFFAAPVLGQEFSNDIDGVIGDSNKDSLKREVQGELLITVNEEKAMSQLQKLLKKYKGTSMEAGLWFRMAELHLRRSKTARFFEMHREDDKIVRITPDLAQSSSSKKSIQQGVEIYEKIQAAFPHFRDMDLVYFNNAFARQQLRQNSKAKSIYERLLKQYPESALVPDTQLALGEMLFEDRKYSLALAHYKAIRNYPQSNVYGYGLYKEAWTEYNLQDTEKALKTLEEVVSFSQEYASDIEKSKLSLRKEALSDMVLFFSEFKPSSQAVGYFSKQAHNDEVGELIIKLAKLYKHHSQYKDLKVALEDFINDFPKAIEIPSAYVELVTGSHMTQDYLKSAEYLAGFARVCEKREGDCSRELYTYTGLYSTKWHKTWMKNKKESKLADAAEKAYQIHIQSSLELLKSTPKIYNLKSKALYAYGDLLFQRAKYQEAWEQYYLSAQSSPDGKEKHLAAYAALVSLEKSVKDSWSDEDERTFNKIADFYLQYFTKGEYANEIRFKRGFIAYEKGRFDDAEKVFKPLAISSNSHDSKVQKAQDLYLDILNHRKDYKTLKEESFQWMKGASAQRRVKLQKIHEESYFSEIQNMVADNKKKKALDAYAEFYKSNPKSNLSEQARWNYILLCYELNHLLDGAQSAIEFYDLYPQATKNKEALVKAAETFEFLGRPYEAAQSLERMARLEPKDAQKWKLLAAGFYAAAGEKGMAKKLYEPLLNAEDKDISSNALRSLYYLYPESSYWPKLVLKQSVEPEASLIRIKEVQSWNELTNKSLAFRYASDWLSQKWLPESVHAEARLVQARILADEFKSQSIMTTPDRLTYILQIKTERLDKAQRAFNDVIRYKNSKSSVSALHELGRCYDHYVKSLKGLKVKGHIPEKELKALRSELDRLTLPMEDKAAETLNEALKLARKIGLRDGSIAEIQKNLNELNMVNTLQVQNTELAPPAFEVPYLMSDVSSSNSKAVAVVSIPMEKVSADLCKSRLERLSYRALTQLAASCVKAKANKKLEAVAYELMSQEPYQPWGAYFMSLSQELKGNLNSSEWYINLALKKNEKYGILHYQLGRIYWAQEKIVSSSKEMESGLRLDPSLTEAQLFLGQLDYRDQQFESASEHFYEVLKSQPKNVLALTGLVESRIQRRDSRGALEILERGLSSHPERVDFLLRQGQIFETMLNDRDRAFNTYLMVLKKAKSLGQTQVIKQIQEKLAELNVDNRQPASSSIEKNQRGS